MPTVTPSRQVLAWDEGVERTIATVGIMNRAVAELVDTVGMLIDTDGWVGWGIASVDHWLTWNANVSKHRAHGLVRIARRRAELPVCWAAFREGRLTEDAMVRIAKRVPSSEDAQAAQWGAMLTISQLTRVLGVFPPLADPDPNLPPNPPDPQRFVHAHTAADGWVRGAFSLPPDEGARFTTALAAARDAEHRDRQGLEPDAVLADGASLAVRPVDAFVRMCSAAVDGLDPTLLRTGQRGDRFGVVLHHDVRENGSLGPGQLHLGEHLPDAIARFLSCDADRIHVLAKQGRILGITPDERTPNRRLRRALEHRDGGCAHPLCQARRWLHVHHLHHWEDGGPTIPSNLVCLCPAHHRALHQGDFTISGDPETGTMVFTDRWGRTIAPPELGATELPPPPNGTEPYARPCGEPLRTRDWTWN